jgi:glycosyltransferase involved in cell wall biosynthesis
MLIQSFAIVTPNYNMAAYLAQTIESVLSNMRAGDQYFIIDGGSTDGSLEIIKQYASHLTGWISEKDGGYADALAKGFARSTADFQCWINCGDLILPGALTEARGKLSATGADLIFGDDLYIDEKGKVLQVTNGQTDELANMMLYGGWTPLQDACYWRRSLYEKVGGIDPDQRYAADYDLFLRMSLSGVCRNVPSVFSAFRRHTGQTSNLHAVGYRNERERCRQRELRRLNIGVLRGLSLSHFYTWKVRWRARMNSRNLKLNHVAGTEVTDMRCTSFGAVAAE